MIDSLRDLIYHHMPARICYALARAEIRSLNQVRRRTREQLLAAPDTGVTYIERTLNVIAAAEIEDAIARDVYSCPAGQRCRIATTEQRIAFDQMIAAWMQGWRATHAPRASDRPKG